MSEELTGRGRGKERVRGHLCGLGDEEKANVRKRQLGGVSG